MELELVKRVAFNIFGIDIYWYGLFITGAIILDFLLLLLFTKKKGLDSDLPYDLILILIPLSVIFARLFSVLFEEDLTLLDYFKFRDGGMSIIGAIIGGACGLALYCKIKKKNFLVIADIIAPLLILGQAIGRWGNYFNSEVYGKLITDPNLQWFPLAVKVGNSYYQALFFYESVFNLIGFALLCTLLFTLKNKKGIVLATYLVFYGIVRIVMESFRQEEYILKLGSIHISQVFAGVMIACGIGLFVYVIINSIKKKIPNETVRVYNDGKNK